MLLVREGDEGAFREIVERYQKQILDLCFRYVRNQADAEEVAMDVFVQLYKSRLTYRPEAKLSTYLYRIAVNLSLNRIRVNHREFRKFLRKFDSLLTEFVYARPTMRMIRSTTSWACRVTSAS